MKLLSNMVKRLSTITLTALLALGLCGTAFATDPEISGMKKQDKAKEVQSVVKQTKIEAQKPDTINVNSADLEELQSLKGVGVAKAKAIIVFRENNGKFTSIDQMTQVSGLGESFVEQNKSKVSF
jgi:competence protein ComEA